MSNQVRVMNFSARQMAMMGVPDLPLEAFGGMKPIPRAMRSQGMTLHKGGGLTAVVAVVAAVAIPFVAPAIAASIGVSGAIAGAAASAGLTAATAATVGSVVGSAIVGAGLGAVSAAVTGGDVGRAALMGGIGSGISGYISAPGMPSSAVPNQAITAASNSADPIAALNASQGWTTSAAAPANIAVTNSGAVATMGPTGWEVNGVAVPSNTIAYGGQVDSALATQLSSAQDATAAANAIQQSGTLSVNTPQAIGGNAGYLGTTNYVDPNAGVSAANAAQGGASYSQAGLQVTPAAERAASAQAAFTPSSPQAQTVAAETKAAGTATGGGAGGSQAPTTLSQALLQKFTDPRNQADMILRAAGQMAGSAIAGDGLSPEEKQLLAQQKAELEQLKKTNQELFNQRVQGAQDLLGESRYFDPSYFGLQSARNVMNQGARAKQQALREIGPNRAGLRASEGRRFDLGIGTGSQTAYMQGADNAEQNKVRLQTAGLSALPLSGPTGALQYGNYLGTLYDAADKRRRQTAADVGSLFGSFTGASSSRSTG